MPAWTRDPAVVLAALAAGGFVAVVGAVMGRWGWLWVQARAAGLRLPLLDLLFMSLRRVDVRSVVRAAMRLHRAGLGRPLSSLETHQLAGGRLDAVVTAVLEAERAGSPLPWDTATACDLAGVDLAGLVARAGPGVNLAGLAGAEVRARFDVGRARERLDAMARELESAREGSAGAGPGRRG